MTVPISGAKGGMDGDDFGTKLGAGYAYNFSSRLALMTGLEYSNYSGRITYSVLRDKYSAPDYTMTPPSRVTYSYYVSGYREQQSLSLMSLPVMLRLTTELDGMTDLYFAAGCKIAIPVSAKARISGNLVSSAFFEHEDVDYSNLPEHDLYNGYPLIDRRSDIKTKPAALFSMESGLRFHVGRVSFFAALNLDCSLNSLKATSDNHPMNFTDAGLSCESLLNSSFTEKLNITSFGLKLGIGMK